MPQAIRIFIFPDTEVTENLPKPLKVLAPNSVSNFDLWTPQLWNRVIPTSLIPLVLAVVCFFLGGGRLLVAEAGWWNTCHLYAKKEYWEDTESVLFLSVCVNLH